jgi:hypothetical protein
MWWRRPLEYANDFSVSSRQWFFSSRDQLCNARKHTKLSFCPKFGAQNRTCSANRSDLVKLVVDILQQLGKVTLPLVELQFFLVQNLL